MILANQICTVKIDIDHTYTIGSADNKYYGAVMNPSDLGRNDFTKTFAISVDLHHSGYAIALIGSGLSCESDCALLEDRSLLMLLDDVLIRIDVLSGTLTAVKRIERFGGKFGIYRIPQGYIIYGEIEIMMLDENLEIQWSFAGRDIFATPSGRKAFLITDASIELYDWEENYYQIDFDGNLIREISKA